MDWRTCCACSASLCSRKLSLRAGWIETCWPSKKDPSRIITLLSDSASWTKSSRLGAALQEEEEESLSTMDPSTPPLPTEISSTLTVGESISSLSLLLMASVMCAFLEPQALMSFAKVATLLPLASAIS